MKYFFFVFTIIFLSACEQETPKQDTSKCKYGQPVAIFSKSHDQITKQSFEVMGQKGVEIIEFANGNTLELYQSGCNDIRQEFRFHLNGDFREKEDSFWFNKAIEQLSYVGQLEDKYAIFGMWVGAIQSMNKQMKIGQFSEAELNTFIMVDKFMEEQSSMVIIVLERRNPEKS